MSSVYKLVYSKKVLKQLKKLDKNTSKYLMKYVENNIKDASDPRLRGKALVGDRQGLWRYRIGDYRLICKIEDDKLIILALSLGHRREIYR